MTHTHTNRAGRHTVILNSGGHYEVCECGATRKVEHDGKAEPWHVCKLCTPQWFKSA